MTDFTKLKVGTKVWSVSCGWGEIINVNTDNYPIICNFECDERCFTKNGKFMTSDKYPSLFLHEFKIPESAYKSPLPQLEVNTEVLVWDDDGGEKQKRRFSHFDKSNRIHCFTKGNTSWSGGNTVYWDNWEIYKEAKK